LSSIQVIGVAKNVARDYTLSFIQMSEFSFLILAAQEKPNHDVNSIANTGVGEPVF